MEDTRICIIKIQPDNEENQMSVETGGLSYFEIVHYLHNLQRKLASDICKVAEKKVGPNSKKQEQWIDEQMKKYVK